MALTKVVLSPCLFELMSYTEPEIVEMAHYNHILDLFTYLQQLNVEFDLYENAPYFPDGSKRPPITRYHFHKVSCSALYAKIQRKISFDSNVELSDCEASEIVTDYTYPEKSETKDSFLRYITFLIQHASAFLLFIGEANKDKSRTMKFLLPDSTSAECTPIFNPATDCSGQLHSVLPQTNNSCLFPNSEYCSELNCEYLSKKDEGDQKSIIRQYGNESAIRNGYTHDPRLSMLNSKKQHNSRIVYRRLIGNKDSYLSLDLESGGFEVFDHTPTHLGQYSFAGKRNKEASPGTHKLFLK